VGGAPCEEAQVYYGIGPMVGEPLIGSSATSGQRPSSRQQELQTALTPNPNEEEATNINDLMGRFEGTLSLPQLVKTERVAYADEPCRSGMRQAEPKVEIDLM